MLLQVTNSDANFLENKLALSIKVLKNIPVV